MVHQPQLAPRSGALVAGIVLLCLSCLIGTLFPKQSPRLEIQGRVVRPDGSPAAGASVYVTRLGSALLPKHSDLVVRADSDGRFRFASAPNQAYQLCAHLKGVGIGLTNTGDGSGHQIDLIQAESVQFHMVDAKGRPVPGVTVRPSRIGLPQGGFGPPPDFYDELAATSDSQGQCQAPDIPKDVPASYSVAPETYAELDGFLSPTDRLGQFEHVFVLGPGHSVTGVLTQDGEPIAGATVSIQSVPPKWIFATTGHDGRFELKSVPEGLATLKAYGGQVDWVAQDVRWRVDSALRGEVKIAAIPGAHLTATVLDPLGQPVKWAQVSVVRDQETPEEAFGTMTDADGTFRATLLPGTYRIRLQDRAIQGESPITLQQADEKTVRLVTTSASAELSVSVEDPSGNPVRDALACLYPANSSRPYWGRTFADQTKVVFHTTVDSLIKARVKACYHDLVGDSIVPTAATDLTIRLHPVALASLQGTVLDPQGRPVNGAIVALERSKATGPIGDMDILRGLKRMTGSKGEFLFSGLYPGRAPSITVRAPGYRVYDGPSPDLHPGQNLKLPVFHLRKNSK